MKKKTKILLAVLIPTLVLIAFIISIAVAYFVMQAPHIPEYISTVLYEKENFSSKYAVNMNISTYKLLDLFKNHSVNVIWYNGEITNKYTPYPQDLGTVSNICKVLSISEDQYYNDFGNATPQYVVYDDCVLYSLLVPYVIKQDGTTAIKGVDTYTPTYAGEFVIIEDRQGEVLISSCPNDSDFLYVQGSRVEDMYLMPSVYYDMTKHQIFEHTDESRMLWQEASRGSSEALTEFMKNHPVLEDYQYEDWQEVTVEKIGNLYYMVFVLETERIGEDGRPTLPGNLSNIFFAVIDFELIKNKKEYELLYLEEIRLLEDYQHRYYGSLPAKIYQITEDGKLYAPYTKNKSDILS